MMNKEKQRERVLARIKVKEAIYRLVESEEGKVGPKILI